MKPESQLATKLNVLGCDNGRATFAKLEFPTRLIADFEILTQVVETGVMATDQKGSKQYIVRFSDVRELKQSRRQLESSVESSQVLK